MKQTLLTLALCLAAIGAAAQPANHVRQNGHHINTIEQLAAKGAQPYKLTKFYTSDLYNIQWFEYDQNDRLVAVIDSLHAQEDSYYVIDSVHYNAQGQLVRLAGWQRLNGIIKNVYYVDYDYDANGNIASRTNYNNFDGEWYMGGIYEYNYNADNQIISSTLSMSGIIFQRIEWEYRDGKKYKETWYSYDFSGFYPSEVIWFRYNDLG